MLLSSKNGTLFGTCSKKQNPVLLFLSELYKQFIRTNDGIKKENKIPGIYWNSSEYNFIFHIQMCFNKALRDLTFYQQINIERIECGFEFAKSTNVTVIAEILQQLSADLKKICEMLDTLGLERNKSVVFKRISTKFATLADGADGIDAFIKKTCSPKELAVQIAEEHIILTLKCLEELKNSESIKIDPKALDFVIVELKLELMNLRSLCNSYYCVDEELSFDIGKILHNVHDLLVKNNTLLNISSDFLSENLFKKVFAPDEMVKIDPYLKAFAVSCSECCHP